LEAYGLRSARLHAGTAFFFQASFVKCVGRAKGRPYKLYVGDLAKEYGFKEAGGRFVLNFYGQLKMI